MHALETGASPAAAFERAFGVPVAALEHKLDAYVHPIRRVRTALPQSLKALFALKQPGKDLDQQFLIDV
jgi:hypothetical protein